MDRVLTPGPLPLAQPSGRIPHVARYALTGNLWRISNDSHFRFASYPSPRYRFDAPNGQYQSVYTCAQDIGTFAEVYVERGRRLGIEDGQRYLLELRSRIALALIDLHDIGTVSTLNLDERISIGDDYATCQACALFIYEQCPDVSGIRYRARKAGALTANVFLFADRCVDHLELVESRRLDEIEDVVLRAADRYRLTVAFPFKV